MPPSSINLTELEKNWKVSLKHTEFGIVEPIFRQNDFERLKNLPIDKNWIKETLLLDKKYNLLRSCETLIMIGCGMYPYSMIDTFKRFPNINQIGIDYDVRCATIASQIVEKCNFNSIKIVNCDGVNYDYSSLKDEDMVFISCDVNGIDDIYSRVLKTSKAQIFVCAPSRTAWLDNYLLGS